MAAAAAASSMADSRDDADADDWPVCENVLRSLSEDVRPKQTDGGGGEHNAAVVAANVLSCLAERVTPTAAAMERLRRPWWRRQPWPRDCRATAARRLQTRLMAVRSAYADGKYYAPGTPHVSRTVEELCAWTADAPTDGRAYVVGTVQYDGHTGECHLHGLADPRCRVAVRCDRLTDALPRHRSTVKMFSALRWTRWREDGGGGGGGDGCAASPFLEPEHFQTFSCASLFR